MTKNVFIAATRQNKGKTMVSLGLIFALKKRFKNIGFIKPVGQRYVDVDGHKIDEDSILVERVCGLDCRLFDMSPVAIESNFTARYIMRPSPKRLTSGIKKSYRKMSEGKDAVVIEGTGHAGVGSVFDLSNASVAKMLNSKVVIVAGGGIGRPIDEVMLNKPLFEDKGVKILGVVINKVRPDKYNKIRRYVKKGLQRQGVKFLGAVPYEKVLSSPTIGEIKDELGADLLNGVDSMGNRIEDTIVGAMTAHQAISYFHSKTLVITPGDREDIILGAMTSCPIKRGRGYAVGGILLTGSVLPHKNIMDLIKRTLMPVIYFKGDTYTAASMIHDTIVKIRPDEERKVRLAAKLVEKYVDVDYIVRNI